MSISDINIPTRSIESSANFLPDLIISYLRYLAFKENADIVAGRFSSFSWFYIIVLGHLKELPSRSGHIRIAIFRNKSLFFRHYSSFDKSIRNKMIPWDPFYLLPTASDLEIKSFTQEHPNVHLFGRSFISEAKKAISINHFLSDYAANVQDIRSKIYFVASPEGVRWSIKPKQNNSYLAEMHEAKGGLITNEEMNLYYKSKLTELHNIVSKQSVVLLLGTGISFDYGVDDWAHLSGNMENLLEPILASNTSKIKKVIGDNTYAAASYSRFSYETSTQTDDYYKAIAQSLYRKYTGVLPSDTTLAATLHFARKHEPRIYTFNYDDFFEALGRQETHHSFVPVYNENTESKALERKKKYLVYHVHGYLPKGKINDDMKQSVVLSQEEYFSAYGSVPSWGIKKVRKILAEDVSISIGLSFSDIFLRNLLNEVNKTETKEGSYLGRRFILLYDQGLSSIDKWMVTLYFLKMKITVVWSGSYEEMQKLLRNDFSLPADISDDFGTLKPESIFSDDFGNDVLK